MDQLRVDADQAYNTSHAVSNDAEELRDELAQLEHDWDTLSRGWSGVASSAYSAIWEDWRQGAITLVEALAESSQKLGVAAVRYSEQDADSANVIDTSTMNLGL